MIPILYDYNEQTFTSNGLGRLSDCLSCTVTEERNGRFDLEFTYPVTGLHFDEILEGRIIAVTHDEGGDVQPFIIYSSSKPLDGVVTFNAYHLSYILNNAVVNATPFHYPRTAQDLMVYAAGHATTAGSAIAQSFTYLSDITDVKSGRRIENPLSFRAFLGGSERSVLSIYGGEFEFDKWTVNLWQARGSNKGVTIRYGKNLTDFKAETDFSGTYTHVYALYSGDDLDAKNDRVVVVIDSGQRLPGNRSAYQVVDFSSNIADGETKTAAQITTELQTLGTNYAAAHKIWDPAVSMDVDFVQLWQTEEYKNYAPLLICKLCDTVNVSFPFYGLADLAIKIVSVEWDALNDRYVKMTLGGLATTLSESINGGVSGSIQANADAIAAVGSRTWVSDVTVNGSSVVTDGVAAVTVPTSAKTAFTPTSGSSYSTYGGCFYEVYGNVVVVNISVSGLTANTNTAIYTLPSGVRPKSRVFGKAGSGSGQGLSSIDINTTGVISVVSAGTYCIGSVTYIL